MGRAADIAEAQDTQDTWGKGCQHCRREDVENR